MIFPRCHRRNYLLLKTFTQIVTSSLQVWKTRVQATQKLMKALQQRISQQVCVLFWVMHLVYHQHFDRWCHFASVSIYTLGWGTALPNPTTENRDSTKDYKINILIQSLGNILTSHNFTLTCIILIGQCFTFSSVHAEGNQGKHKGLMGVELLL